MKLIFDRTLEDVLLKNPKGFYGWEDLNRVERGIAELRRRMRELDISLVMETKTDWALPGDLTRDLWPTPEQMDRLLQNIHKLLIPFRLKKSLPGTMENLDWKGANKIEEALDAVDRMVRGVESTFKFSGECIAGKENTI